MLGKIRKMYAFFRDPKAPLKPKLLIGAALLYFVIPTDLIPDFIPMLGLTDDLAALMMIWKQVSYVLNTYQTPQPVLDGEEIIGEEIT